MSANSKNNYTSASVPNQVPEFNPDTLRSLTDRIANNLKNKGKGPILKDIAARPKNKTSNIKRKLGEHAIKSTISNPAGKAGSNGSMAKGKEQPTLALKQAQGKKRLRDGRVKERSIGTNGNSATIGKLETSKTECVSDNDTFIDDEVRALGGTKEDVDLVANIISGSEIEEEQTSSNNNPRRGLEEEVLQLVRQLGVDRLAQEDSMAEFESEEADGVDKMEENRSHDLMSSNQETSGTNLALPKATSVNTSQQSLVSRKQYPVVRLNDNHANFGLT